MLVEIGGGMGLMVRVFGIIPNHLWLTLASWRLEIVEIDTSGRERLSKRPCLG